MGSVEPQVTVAIPGTNINIPLSSLSAATLPVNGNQTLTLPCVSGINSSANGTFSISTANFNASNVTSSANQTSLVNVSTNSVNITTSNGNDSSHNAFETSKQNVTINNSSKNEQQKQSNNNATAGLCFFIY